MKKRLSSIGLCVALLVGAATLSGCNLSDEQVKVIAQNTGLAAAITWISYDAPDADAKAFVAAALDIVVSNVANVQAGQTYTQVVYPKIEDFIRSPAVPDQYEPIVLAGSGAALNGLDLLLVTNPAWKDTEGLVLDVVTSFVTGAKIGLSLDDNDPRIKQALQYRDIRAKAYKK